jgi:hypothetical protein
VSSVDFKSLISIKDGMNGMEELPMSVPENKNDRRFTD